MNTMNKFYFTLTLLASFFHIIPSYSIFHGKLITQCAFTALIQHPGFSRMVKEKFSTKTTPPEDETPKKSVFEEDLKRVYGPHLTYVIEHPKKSAFELNLGYPFQIPDDTSKPKK